MQLKTKAYHQEQRAIWMHVPDTTGRDAAGIALAVGATGIVAITAAKTPYFMTDSCRSTAKRFCNATHAAVMGSFGHDYSPVLGCQVNIGSWHGTTLQR